MLNTTLSARKRSALFAAVLATAALQGCAPFGQQPPTATITPVDQWDAGAAIRAASPGEPAAPRWWRALGDAQLDRILDDALDGAPSLRVQHERVEQALAEARVEHAAQLPKLDAEADAVAQRLSNSYRTPPPAAGHWQVDAQALLTASWDLDLAGRLRAMSRAARLRADRQRALEDAAKVSLEAAIVETYLQLALEQQLLAIAHDTLAQHEHLLRLTTARVDADIDMQVAALRAGEPVPLAQASIERHNAAAAQLKHRLAALVGKGPGYADTLVASAGALVTPLPLPAVLPASLVGTRPDVLAARYDVEAQSAGIDAAHAAFYPDINLLAFAGVQSYGFRALLHGSSGTLGAGPALTLPIFEGGRLQAELRAQRSAYNAAVAAYDDTVVNALAQVSDALTEIDALSRERGLHRQALEQARQAYDIETRRYAKGIAGYLDVLLAQGRLLEDRTSAAQADASFAIEHVRLIAALGGASTTVGALR